MKPRRNRPGRQPLLIPRRVTIETIFGCNCNCVMCPSRRPTKRKRGIMPMPLFRRLIDRLVPYRDMIEMMDLYCLGEPLMDPLIFDRIRYVKERGFRNVAISTNADLLDAHARRRLLESGIDTVLFSIDGVRKRTHEAIRRGVKFERVRANVESIIRMRDKGGYKTRFVLRFIRQDSNRDEWEPYKKYWGARISRDKRDFITAYDVHSWGGQVSTKDRVLAGSRRDPRIERLPCRVISEILYVLSNGVVPLCHEDWLHPLHAMGNVARQDPIAIFNSPRFRRIRALHRSGRKNRMAICRECTALYSESSKEVV